MKEKLIAGLSVLAIMICTGWAMIDSDWLHEKHKGYTLTYKLADAGLLAQYASMADQGMKQAEQFFGFSYKQYFTFRVHPSRTSLDSAWRTDWHQPGFRSQCWMVASGVGSQLDLLSLHRWKEEACEHHSSDTEKNQQLVAHELVHVFHGQLNQSPDFSQTDNIDWFVEGLATYASGQCDTRSIHEVKKALAENKAPATLDRFWTGRLRYAFSGSLVMYIDNVYGRATLLALLPHNKLNGILQVLQTDEKKLLEGWKHYFVSH